MNMTDIFAEIFEESIKSVHGFDEKLKVIKSLIEKETSKQNAKKLNAYFRGDKQNSNVQCKLFRCGKLSDEAKLFDEWKNDWQESGEKLSNDEFENLIRMQHEEKTFTRLLDFSTDPKVALRFACGRKIEYLMAKSEPET